MEVLYNHINWLAVNGQWYKETDACDLQMPMDASVGRKYEQGARIDEAFHIAMSGRHQGAGLRHRLYSLAGHGHLHPARLGRRLDQRARSRAGRQQTGTRGAAVPA